MKEVLKGILVILFIVYKVDSSPQFFGQSFASSSVVDSSGKVVSKSVYTDTTGKKIINQLPQLEVDILPPFLPNQLPGQDFLASSPFNKPTTPILSLEVEPPFLPDGSQREITQKLVRPTSAPTTATTTTVRPIFTTRITKLPTINQQPSVSNSIQNGAKKQSAYQPIGETGAYKVQGTNDGQYRYSGKDDGSYKARGDDGTYKPKGNLGIYVHNNAGKYVHDSRGKYRGI